jgi:[glutamine synthetase] adenylyltransferase / [glutamine synthetase]-adenylyl-L-tyrosine phosphorylase
MSFDKQITITETQLRDLGFDDCAQAQKNLDLLFSSLGAEGGFLLNQTFLANLSQSADPDMALNNLERFVGGLPDIPRFVALCREQPSVVRLLITICGASRFLAAFIVTDVDETLSWFADPEYLDRNAGKAALRQRLAVLGNGADDRASLARMLRIFRKREMLRIGLRDLLGKADLRETVAELSDLAEVCLQKAYETAGAEVLARYGRPCEEHLDGSISQAGFAVIAMGKLGGRELNFSSDVDLMYVYTSDGETEGVSRSGGATTNRITNHEYFIKLAEKLSALINEKTSDGFVFRVDLRLRPEGHQGPLAQSLGGYEIYYESWGQTWERSALVKARPVAGDDATGREFLVRILPFVYRKYLDYSAIAEIRDMKQKINQDVEHKGRTHRDVKLGYGGIREIEFIIQAIQLLHGGRDRSLREKRSLKALHMLSQKGLITYEEHAILAKAYVFLRNVEHRIQILDDIQTQTMPSDDRELRTLARRMGHRERGKEAEALLREYAEHTNRVRRIYDDLFTFTGEESAGPEQRGEYGLLLDPETSEHDAVAMLGRLGFRDPGKAYRNVILLREGPAFVHQTPRSRKLFSGIFPPLFGEIVSSSDPDMALHHLESFLAAQGSWEAFQSLLKIDTTSVKVLIAVFANSEYLSRLLVSRPHILQSMLETRKHAGQGALTSYRRDLDEQLEGVPGITEKLDCIRRFKHQEEIRIGMTDLLSDAGLRVVSRELSRLAEVCLGTALNLAGEEIGRRYGGPGTTEGLSIISAGKLGGRELIYGSDLDIFFVYSEAHAAAPSGGLSVFERFSKVAEKTISYLSTLTREGFVFRIDTRLRPTGSKGPLVQSIEACRNYYASQAETWELQALLRARFAAGDRAVGTEFCAAIQELIFHDFEPTALSREIRTMRRRMEEELGNEDAMHYNIKQGRGGIVDIEFLVQYLQLLHGKRLCRLRIPGTYNALGALKKEKVLQAEEYRSLRHAYLFMRLLESRMRIIANQTTSMLKKDPGSLHTLARRMGYPDTGSSAAGQLLADYENISKQIRSIFDRMLIA